mgnify:CR=1 FL=1
MIKNHERMITIPNINDIFDELHRRTKKEEARAWRKSHFFDIYNAVLSTAAIIISLIALIVSICK